MAKVYENKKGFKVIQATRGEMICALSEYGCVGICDSCGSSNCQDGFYIAVLNCWYCLIASISGMPELNAMLPMNMLKTRILNCIRLF